MKTRWEPNLFQIEIRPEAALVEVTGHIDSTTSSYLETAIQVAAFGSSDQIVVVALKNCSSLDSSCLAVLIQAKNTLKSRLRVIPPATGLALGIFETMCLDRLFDQSAARNEGWSNALRGAARIGASTRGDRSPAVVHRN